MSYLERGRNIDPSMKTAPDSRIYQHEAISPRLQKNKEKVEKFQSIHDNIVAILSTISNDRNTTVSKE